MLRVFVLRVLVVPVVVVLVVVGWLGGPASAGAAAWEWPVVGPHLVSRPFDPPAHRYAAGHRGADLPGLPGMPVRAAGAGRVSYAGLLAGRGVVVVVHGALRTTYEPVTATVALGSTVAAGEVLGLLDAGHSGCPAPACLHWGLKRGEDHLDPVRLVERGPVRLLPLAGTARWPTGATAGTPVAAGTGGPEAAAPVAPEPRGTARSASGRAGVQPAGASGAQEPVRRSGGAADGALSPTVAAGLASTAAASLLGAAAAGAVTRRRRT